MSITTEQSAECDEPTDSRTSAAENEGVEASAHQTGAESLHDGSEPMPDSPAQPSVANDSEISNPTTSSAQVEANRRNAQKSTGPRSEAGKRMSSKNAMTHGAYAQAHAIPRGVLAESDFDVEGYVNVIITALAPRDALELVVARRIATSDLRLSRLERYESVALGKVGRLRPELGEAMQWDVNLARQECLAAQAASRYLKSNDDVAIDLGTWQTIAWVIWDIHDTPEHERAEPDIPDDHENALAIWRRFVVEDLMKTFWGTVRPACAALDAGADRLADFCNSVEGKAEERAVTAALERGGPLDSVSTLRARVQREGERDRDAYAKLQERVLDIESDAETVPPWTVASTSVW